MDDPKDYSRDFLAVEELFKGVLEAHRLYKTDFWTHFPNPLHLCDSSWDPYTSTAGEIII